MPLAVFADHFGPPESYQLREFDPGSPKAGEVRVAIKAAGVSYVDVLDGTVAKGGRLPVNPSGGLKSKGHPIGATGVSMHVLSAMQLAGEAGGMQVPGATLGGVFNMGGAAVANYVSVLERIK